MNKQSFIPDKITLKKKFHDLIKKNELKSVLSSMRNMGNSANITKCKNQYNKLIESYTLILKETIDFMPALYQRDLWKTAYTKIYAFYYLLHSQVHMSSLCYLAHDVFEQRSLQGINYIYFVGNLSVGKTNREHAFSLDGEISDLYEQMTDEFDYKKTLDFIKQAEAIENLEKINISFEQWYDMCSLYGRFDEKVEEKIVKNPEWDTLEKRGRELVVG